MVEGDKSIVSLIPILEFERRMEMEGYIENFIRDFADEIVNENAALFAGAGFSKEAGFVDWKGLLRGIADEMNLNIDKEDDLISVAQYYVNNNGRPGINNIIGNEL